MEIKLKPGPAKPKYHPALVSFAFSLTLTSSALALADDRTPITISIQATLPTLGYSIYNDIQSIEYSTNNSIIPKLSIQRGGLGGSYGTSTGRLDDDIALDTRSRDFQGFYYFDKIGLDFYYQEYRGYYIDKEPVLSEDYFPDLAARTYTLNYYHKISGSNKMSAMSTAIPSTRTISTLYYAMASISNRSLQSSKTFIPAANSSAFPAIDTLNSFHIVNASLSAGLYVPVHINKWYFNTGLAVGLGTPITRFSDDIKSDYSVKVNIKASMGYASKKFQFGMDVSNDSDAFELISQDTIQFHSIRVNFILISYTF